MNVKKNDNRSADNISYKVYGYVRNQYQQPFAGGVIQALDNDIRSEQILGKAQTSALGY